MLKKIILILSFFVVSYFLVFYLPAQWKALTLSNDLIGDYENRNEVKLAKELRDISTSALQAEKEKFKAQITDLTEDEFVGFIYNIVKNNEQEIEVLTERLEQVDVEIALKNQMNMHPLNINELNLTILHAKRGGSTLHSLIAYFSANREARPATLDVVSIEWDPTYAEYYGSTVPNTMVTRKDGSARLNGLYLFNVDDAVEGGIDAYCAVQVTPKKSGRLNYRAKYTHTYAVMNDSSLGEAAVEIEQNTRILMQ